MTTKSVSLVRILEAADKFKECNTIHWCGSSSLNRSNSLFSALLVVFSEITLGIILAIITPILRFPVNLLFIWTKFLRNYYIWSVSRPQLYISLIYIIYLRYLYEFQIKHYTRSARYIFVRIKLRAQVRAQQCFGATR